MIHIQNCAGAAELEVAVAESAPHADMWSVCIICTAVGKISTNIECCMVPQRQMSLFAWLCIYAVWCLMLDKEYTACWNGVKLDLIASSFLTQHMVFEKAK